jgi:hypothetical protein
VRIVPLLLLAFCLLILPVVAANTGTLSIGSSPAGAKIYLNGVNTGYTTNHNFYNMPAGGYIVRLTHAGYTDRVVGVAVNVGQITAIGEQLDPIKPVVKHGGLLISSKPPGANIMIDGIYQGVTSTTISGLDAGSHRIRIAMAGYEAYEGNVIVNADKTNPVSVTLTKLVTATKTTSAAPGSIDIRSQPTGATITLDGSQLGLTPAQLTNIKAGSHTLKLSLTGYSDWRQPVTVNSGSTTNVNAALYSLAGTTTTAQPPVSDTGSLSVTTIPAGAQVYVDDIFLGYSPTITSGLTAGSHAFVIKMDGYKNISASITITSGQTTEYTSNLVSETVPIYEKVPGYAIIKRAPGFSAILGILAIAGILAGRRIFRR